MDYYKDKYHKYKLKYFNLLNQSGGGDGNYKSEMDAIINKLDNKKFNKNKQDNIYIFLSMLTIEQLKMILQLDNKNLNILFKLEDDAIIELLNMNSDLLSNNYEESLIIEQINKNSFIGLFIPDKYQTNQIYQFYINEVPTIKNVNKQNKVINDY